MAGELIMSVSRGDVMRESALGYNPWTLTALTGSFGGIRLNKFDIDGYTFKARIPANLTMGTGLTFSFDFVDNAEFANDPGLVVRLGITVKRLAAGATLSMDSGTGLATEILTNVTSQATSGLLTVGTLPIALAALPASLAVGDRFGVRIRRNGNNAADTFKGSVILTGFDVTNT